MSNMDDMLDEVVLIEDLKKFEKIYHEQLYQNNVTYKAQFEYAWCLVRSKYTADIRKGIMLLEDLYTNDVNGKRDYLYYLAIGNARIKEYTIALNYIRSFLQIEPGNPQVLILEQIVKKRMEKEGLVGMALLSGALLVLGGLIAVGLKLSKN